MRILVVEDEPGLRGAIVSGLRWRGHAVDLGGTCRDVEELLVAGTYSAAVLDRMLPDGDSLEVVKRRRSAGITTPVLFLSVLGSLRDRVEGLETGADDYLTKPFEMEELIARVEAIGRRRTEPQPSHVRVGALELHVGRREVRRDGVLIPLRPKEFALLQLLMRVPVRVVGREELLEVCWERGAEPRSNVDRVLVGNLRRKLGTPDVVRTVRGAGYILDEEACGKNR